MTARPGVTHLPAHQIAALVSAVFQDAAVQLRGLEAACLAGADAGTGGTPLRVEMQRLDRILQMLADGQRVSDLLSRGLPADLLLPAAVFEAAIRLEDISGRLHAARLGGSEGQPAPAPDRVELF